MNPKPAASKSTHDIAWSRNEDQYFCHDASPEHAGMRHTCQSLKLQGARLCAGQTTGLGTLSLTWQ
eukprot:6247321-Amphidinium_carterae.1